MPDRPIEPLPISHLVEDWVLTNPSKTGLWDSSDVYSLHRLAAEVYAHGFNDGTLVERNRTDHARLRERRTAEEQAHA